MAKSPVDPNRTRLLELIEAMQDRLNNLRDYALVPGNSWLAKGEVGQMNLLTNEMEELVEQIKQADAEDGL